MSKYYIAKEKIDDDGETGVVAYSQHEEYVRAYIFLNQKRRLTMTTIRFDSYADRRSFELTYRPLNLVLLSEESQGDEDIYIVLTVSEKQELEKYSDNNCNEFVDYEALRNVIHLLKPKYIDLLKDIGYFYLYEIMRITGEMYDMSSSGYERTDMQYQILQAEYDASIYVDKIKLKYYLDAYFDEIYHPNNVH